MGKILDAIAGMMEGIAEASTNFQSIASGTTAANGNVTYGDVVQAVTKCTKDGFWKNRMLDRIPSDADSATYKAAISILEDPNSDDFWKCRALDRVFKRP